MTGAVATKDLNNDKKPALTDEVLSSATIQGSNHISNYREISNFSSKLNQDQFTRLGNAEMLHQGGEILQLIGNFLPEKDKIDLVNTLFSKTLEKQRNATANSRDCLLIDSKENGVTVLDSFMKIISSPLAEELIKKGVTKPQIVAELAKDLIDHSSRIDQGVNNTCLVTAAQAQFAYLNPARYANHIARLVCGEEKINFPFTIDRRGLTDSLYQSWLVSKIPGGYKSAFDAGLYSDQIEGLLESATGKPYKRLDRGSVELMTAVKDSLSEGKCLIASVQGIGNGTHSNHAVDIREIVGDRIFFRNPWPQEYLKNSSLVRIEDENTHICSMKVSDFEKKVNFIVFETSDAHDMGITPNSPDRIGIYESTRFFTLPMFDDYFELQRRRALEEVNLKTRKNVN